MKKDLGEASHWTFFTNYGHTIILIHQYPGITLREIAEKIGITERAVQKIVSDMESCGYLVIEKSGRRNYYQLDRKQKFRHPLESHVAVFEVLRHFERGPGVSRVLK